MPSVAFAVAAVLAAVLAWGTASSAIGLDLEHDDWPQFRGPGGRAVAPHPGPYPAEIDVEHPAWRTPLPDGISSPCIVGKRVFVTGHDDLSLLTLCLDRATGKELWRAAVEAADLERHHKLNDAASSTTAVDDEHVVAYFGSFGLVAYNHDGDELWRRQLPRERNTFGNAVSPLLHAGRVVFLHDSQGASSLKTIDAATGETIWKVDRAGFDSGWSTPTIIERDGRQELLVYGVWWLVSYDLATGAERWRAPGLTDEPITSPVLAGDLILVTSYNMKTNPEVEGLPTFDELLAELDTDENGTLSVEEVKQNKSVLSRHDADGEGDHPLRIFLRQMDGDRNGEITAPEWQKIVDWVDGFAHINGVVALRPPGAGKPAENGGDAPQAEIAWSFPRGVPECPSPVVIEDRLFMVKNGGLATYLDTATGELIWQERTGARGPCYASPVVADGKVYTCSARGELTVLAVADEFRVLARADFDERILATPALAGGRLFVRTEAALYAFD